MSALVQYLNFLKQSSGKNEKKEKSAELKGYEPSVAGALPETDSNEEKPIAERALVNSKAIHNINNVNTPAAVAHTSAEIPAVTTAVHNPSRGNNAGVPRPLTPKKFTSIPRVLENLPKMNTMEDPRSGTLLDKRSSVKVARNTGIVDVDGEIYVNSDDVELLGKLGFDYSCEEYLGLEKTGEVLDVYSYVEKVAGVPREVAKLVDDKKAFSAEYLKDMGYGVPKGYEVKGDLVCPVEKTEQSFQQTGKEEKESSEKTAENLYDNTNATGIEAIAKKELKSNLRKNIINTVMPVAMSQNLPVANLIGAATNGLGLDNASKRWNSGEHRPAIVQGIGATAGMMSDMLTATGVGAPVAAVLKGVSLGATGALAKYDQQVQNKKDLKDRITFIRNSAINHPSPTIPDIIPVFPAPPAKLETLATSVNLIKPTAPISQQQASPLLTKKSSEKTAAADPKKTILITGHSGAGKSTLGKALAEKLNLPLHRVDDHPEFKEYVTRDNEHWKNSLTPGTREYEHYTDLVNRANRDTLKASDPAAIIEGAQLGHLSPKELAKYRAHIVVGGDVEQSIAQRIQRAMDKAAKNGITLSPEEIELRKVKSKLVADYWHPGIEKFRKLPGVLSYNHTEHQIDPLVERLKQLMGKKAELGEKNTLTTGGPLSIDTAAINIPTENLAQQNPPSVGTIAREVELGPADLLPVATAAMTKHVAPFVPKKLTNKLMRFNAAANVGTGELNAAQRLEKDQPDRMGAYIDRAGALGGVLSSIPSPPAALAGGILSGGALAANVGRDIQKAREKHSGPPILGENKPAFPTFNTPASPNQKPNQALQKQSAADELMPHQQRVIDRLKKKDQEGLVLMHGLGSGKTRSSIEAYKALGLPADVIVPAALKRNYQKEIDKWLGESPKDLNIHSQQEIARKGLDDSLAGKLLVVDEAHRMRNEGSKLYNALARANPEKRVLLSGTPIYNHPGDIAKLVNIASGKKLLPEDKKLFESRYLAKEKTPAPLLHRLLGVRPGEKTTVKNREELAKIFNKYIDYHSGNSEGFPSVSSENVYVPMEEKQKNIYKAMMRDIPWVLRKKIELGLAPDKRELDRLVPFLTGARMISNSTANFEKDPATAVSPKINKAFTYLKEHAAEDPNYKAVVYSNYLDSGLAPYKRLLDEAKIPYGEFTGEIDSKLRNKLVQDYNANKLKALLVSSAGGEGLDLKGTKLVQLLEPHFNNEKLKQVIGRAARYKSHEALDPEERKVLVQHYLSTLKPSRLQQFFGKKDTSTDEYLQNLADEKEKLNNEFLNIIKSGEATHELESSNLKAVGHDKKTKLLEVEFRNGSQYEYKNVPRKLYSRLLKAKSHGKFFNKHIKRDNSFEYSKINKK